MSTKVRENRLRRSAARQGLRLVKSRRRDRRALDYGLWQILDDRNRIVHGSDWITLEDVEKMLGGPVYQRLTANGWETVES